MSDEPPTQPPSDTKDDADELDKDIDFFWDVIKRYDTYFVSVNTKATVILTFNTFLLTAVSLKFPDLLCRYQSQPFWTIILYIAAFLMTVCAIASIGMAFYALHPFRKTHKESVSVIFYGNVADFLTPGNYLSKYLETKPRLREDIAAQTHTLAQGLCTKFTWISHSIKALMVELGCLLVIVGLYIFSGLINTCQ